MAKHWKLFAACGAAAVVVGAAGCWIYAVHEAGKRFDAELAAVSAGPLWNVYRVEADVLERTFLSRRFRIVVSDGSDAAYFNGTAAFGLSGCTIKIHTDVSQGAAAALEPLGIQGFSDELTLKTGLGGGLQSASYELGKLSYRDDSRKESISFDGLRAQAEASGGGWKAQAALPGFSASADGQTVLSWKDLSIAYEEDAPVLSDRAAKSGGVLSAEEADGAGLLRAQRAAIRVGAASGELAGFSSARLDLALSPQSESKSKNKADEGDSKTADRWQESIRFVVDKPQGPTLAAYGLTPDRMSGTMRITGITEAFAQGVAALSAGYAAGTHLDPLYALTLLQSAVLNDGLAWHLDDFTISQGKDAVALAGWLGCRPDDASALIGNLASAGQPEVQLGSFSFRAAPSMLSKTFAERSLKQGALKLIDGVYVSEILVTSERVTANGVPIF